MMSKVIKKFAKLLIHTLASVVLVAFMLTLALALALSLPRIQTLAASQAVEWLSNKTNTRINIGSIALENITRLAAKEVYVEGLKGDTILYVGKLRCNINRHKLLTKGELVPYNISANDVVFNLITEENKKTNLDNLVDHITAYFPPSQSASKPFIAENMWLREAHFRLYDPMLADSTLQGVIDYSNMDIDISDLRLKTIAIEGGNVALRNAEILSAIDQSGAKLEKSSFDELTIGKGTLDFRKVDFHSAGSHLRLPHLTIGAETWKDYSQFNDKVNLSLKSRGTIIEAQSAGRFVEVLREINFEGEEINGTFDGTLNDFYADLTAKIYRSDLLLMGSVENITSLSNLQTDVIAEIGTTPSKIEHLYRNLTGENLPDEVERWVTKFDTLEISSEILNNASNLTTYTFLTSPQGEIEVEGTIGYGRESQHFNGSVAGYHLKAGDITEVENLGNTNFFIDGNINLSGGKVEGSVIANIADIEWGDYQYNNINLEASLVENIANIYLDADDSNLVVNLNGNGNLAGEVPEYELIMHLEKADLDAIGLVDEENQVSLSAEVEASLNGRTLDDMVGRAMVNNLHYATATDTLSTDLVNISLTGGESDKSFALTSHVASVNYRSTASYADVLDFFTVSLPAQLPLATTPTPLADSLHVTYGDRLHMAPDHTVVSINIFDGEHLAGVIIPDAHIASGSQIELEFSPETEEFNLTLSSDFVSVGDIYAADIDVEANGTDGYIGLNAETSELIAAGISIPDVGLQAGIMDDDTVTLDLLFSNTDSALSGQLSLDAILRREPNGSIAAIASLKDSYLLSPEQRWDITSKSIDYTTQKVTIDNFAVESETSSININGEISEAQESPLVINIENLNLSEWLDIATSMKDINGNVDGNIELYSTLASPYGKGTLSLSSLSAGGVDMDPMSFDVRIPRRSSEINFGLKNIPLGSTLVEGRYNYETSDYLANVTINELDLSLLNPLLKGVISETSGTSKVFLNLSGMKDILNIDGEVTLQELATTIDYTGTAYTIPQLMVAFDNNRATLATSRIEDKVGGWAQLDGYVDLQNLNSINYGIRLEPHNLSVITLSEGSSEGFYGNVYTSGALTLNATRGATEITGNLRTDTGSVFNLPLTGNNEFAGAEFVTFVDRSVELEEAKESFRVRERVVQERATTQDNLTSNLTIDLGLEVDPSTLLRIIIDPDTDNAIEARGNANLNVTLDSRKNDLSIRGDYQITQGVYNFNFQNLITKEFVISPGSYIRWNGDPLDANIDIAAAYRLKTSLAPLLGEDNYASRATTPVDCIVNLTGSLSKVDVGFDINVPTANTEYQSILSSYFSSQEMMAMQFVYLLAFGNFYSESSGTTTTTPGTAGTAIGLDFLATQLGNLVSNDTYEMKFKYKAIDDTSSSYSVDIQAHITNRLTFEVEANLDTGDYYQTFNNNNNQVTGGGSFTYRLDDDGNFNVKGFTRTIDRFDENQGLQEHGLGLYFQQSFDRFSDLWRKKRGTSAVKSEKNGNFVPPTDTPTPTQTEQGAEANEEGRHE